MTSYASNANRLAALAALPAEEADLISSCVKRLEQLDRGELEPATEAQKHFQLVCQEQLDPETEHELAYIAYKRELLKVLQDEAFDAHKRAKKQSGHRPVVSKPDYTSPAPDMPKRDDSGLNKYGIPEFEHGAPRPGFRPLGRYDRDE